MIVLCLWKQSEDLLLTGLLTRVIASLLRTNPKFFFDNLCVCVCVCAFPYNAVVIFSFFVFSDVDPADATIAEEFDATACFLESSKYVY